MEDRIQKLSHSLPEAFGDTIRRVQGLPESRARLGMNTLMLLTHAKRPLTIEELCDALAACHAGEVLNMAYRPSDNIVLECCQGLVLVDRQEGHVRLAHYTIHEYLSEFSSGLFPRHQAKMASLCLRYLSFRDFESGPLEHDAEILARIAAYPFLDYAAVHWGAHAAPSEADPEVWDALVRFFACRPSTATAAQVRGFAKGYIGIYYDTTESLQLHAAPPRQPARAAQVSSRAPRPR